MIAGEWLVGGLPVRVLIERDPDAAGPSGAFWRPHVARALAIPVEDIDLRTERHRAPVLRVAGDRFGVSFAKREDRRVCALVRGAAVGVDIETIRPMEDLEAAARRAMEPAELGRWAANPEDDRLDAFYRSWTRKEAALKAVGRGLSVDPRDAVVAADGCVRVVGRSVPTLVRTEAEIVVAVAVSDGRSMAAAV